MTIELEFQHAFDRAALDVRLHAEAGFVALLGPSGAGKTRTLDVIAGLLRPDRGRLVIDGVAMADSDRGIWVPPDARRIGYLFQESRLFPHLSVRQNLTFGRWFNRRHAAPAGHTGPLRIDEVVSLLDLAPLLGRSPGRLSGGEARRVALGRALLSQPRLLLLDEPLGSLDVPRRQEILPYLDRLRTELHMPIVYVTHDWGEVEGRATHVIHMDHGRVA